MSSRRSPTSSASATTCGSSGGDPTSPSVMAAADVFAMPSHEEPFGLVFVEAMAMRRPVVALADSGTVEVVEHGRSGLLSTWGDVDQLAADLRTLLLDPALRAVDGRLRASTGGGVDSPSSGWRTMSPGCIR